MPETGDFSNYVNYRLRTIPESVESSRAPSIYVARVSHNHRGRSINNQDFTVKKSKNNDLLADLDGDCAGSNDSSSNNKKSRANLKQVSK